VLPWILLHVIVQPAIPDRPGGESLAKLAAIYSGLVFGIYWIPLRALDAAGFPGIWATAMFALLAAILSLPLLCWRYQRFVRGSPRFHIICIGTGLGFTFYATAFVYTGVISVIVLFYLMPIWGFVFARIFIGDRITTVRWAAMIVAISGLLTILGEPSTTSEANIFSDKLVLVASLAPNNVGDWMALTAGIMWAGIALMILTEDHSSSIDLALGFLVWGAVFSLGFAWLASILGYEPMPDISRLIHELNWLLPFALFVIIPAALATVYGPSKLNPGIVGLFFMAEISVATATAAIWADEPFGPRHLLGVTLITFAGILETIWLWFRKSSAKLN